MMFRLQIDTSGETFQREPRVELARILRKLSINLVTGSTSPWMIQDGLGNPCGIAVDNAPDRATQLAFFLANEGFIDSPGGAEWFGAAERNKQADSFVDSFDRAGVEAASKDWSWLWRPLEGEDGD